MRAQTAATKVIVVTALRVMPTITAEEVDAEAEAEEEVEVEVEAEVEEEMKVEVEFPDVALKLHEETQVST
jgi:hypothetical protein